MTEGLYISAGWSAPSWPGFYPCCGVLSFGSGNSKSCLWPLPKLPGKMLMLLYLLPWPPPSPCEGLPTLYKWTSVSALPMATQFFGATRPFPIYSGGWDVSYLCSYYIKYLLLHDDATKRLHSKIILFTVFSNMALTTNSSSFIKIPNKLVISKKKKQTQCHDKFYNP